MSYEIILLGDREVGKSAFIKRHLTGEFLGENVGDLGVNLSTINFNTNYGPITFNIWNHAGQEVFKGLHESYYKFVDAAIIMFDVTNKNTYKGAKKWINDFTTKGPSVPIIVCGNKTDVLGREVKYPHIRLEYPYYDISVKTNYNFEKPFLCLARTLTGRDDLVFIDIHDDIIPLENSDALDHNAISLDGSDDVISLESSDEESDYTHTTWIDLPDGGRLKITHEYYPVN